LITRQKLPDASLVYLQAELKMLNINNVGIHNLSPGMVTTDLLMAGKTFTHTKDLLMFFLTGKCSGALNTLI
jgi:hypothetical protein